MSIFKTLKMTKQDNSSAQKITTVPLRPVKGTNTVSSHHEMENFDRPRVDESAMGERIGELNSLVKAPEAMFAKETEHAERLINELKSDLGVLQIKLKETQETIATIDLSNRDRQKALTAEIENLQSDLKTKDETLTLRDKEITDYKSKIDEHLKQIAELQLAKSKTEQDAAQEAKSAVDLAKNLQVRIDTLESQLRQAEELDRQKQNTIEELAEKMKGFENIAKDKQMLLTARETEISDLKNELKAVTTRIAEMSSFLRQAASLSRIVEEQEPGTAAIGRELVDPSNSAKVRSVLPEITGETVPPELVQSIITEVASGANLMANLAALLVRQHAKNLGESIEKFPTKRLPELFEALATELTDESRQVDFRWRLAQAAQLYIY
jgi:DNA repair exonuclease SbcCD ATPase subunit